MPVVSYAAGDMISGFQIETWIGSGAMGEVYRARQLSMDRPVALKLLRKDLTDDDESVERFSNEVRLLASLDHPNIVTAFEAGQYEGFYFLAMSFVSGYNLDECQVERGVLPEKETLKVTLKVAKALAYAWERHQLLHRDIKPSNIMIDTDGEVKLTDMGISVRVGERFQGIDGGYAVGTPFYMSPEQASGRSDLDFRADMFSLGATLYHLVTGKPPFDGETPTEIMLKVINEPLPDPRQHNGDLSSGCCKVIKGMMGKDKADRYPSWDEAISDLQDAIHGKPEAAASVPRPPRKKKFKTRGVVPASPRLAPATPVASRERSTFMRLLPWLLGAGGLALILFVVVQLSRDAAPPPPPPEPTNATTVEPEPTPPATDARQARLRALESIYREAVAFEQQNPQLTQAAVQRYQFIHEQAEGTRFGRLAQEAIERLSRDDKTELRQARQMIEMELENQLASNGPQRAIRYLERYNGPYAEELSGWRQQQIAAIRQERRAEHQERQVERVELERRLSSLMDSVAALLIRKDYQEANQQLTRAASDAELKPLQRQIARTRRATGAIASWPEAILQTFRDDVDQEVELLLKDRGRQTVTIRKVEGSKIYAFQQVGSGKIGLTLTLSSLQPDTYLERLARWQSPSRPLALGLVNLWARRGEAALLAIQDLPLHLRQALTRQVHVVMPEAVEGTAASLLAQQLSEWGVEADSPYQVLDKLRQATVSREEQQSRRQAMEVYQSQFGYTAFATKWEPVLQYLLGEEVAGWPVDRRDLIFLWHTATTPELNEVYLPEQDEWIRCHPLADGAARLSRDGAMVFSGEDARFLSKEAGERLTEACRRTNALALECVIRPISLDQEGPARIISCSSGSNSRNLTLGQEGQQLVIRLRTPLTGLNGTKPQILFGDLRQVEMPCHVVISYRDGLLRGWLNGELALETREVQGDFGNWTSQPLVFGNEYEAERPWLGELHRIGLYARTLENEEVKQLFELYRTAP